MSADGEGFGFGLSSEDKPRKNRKKSKKRDESHGDYEELIVSRGNLQPKPPEKKDKSNK
jgi:hypothetical protein